MNFKVEYEDFVETYSKSYRSSKFYPEVLQKFGQGWSVKRISQYFGISYFLVWNWVKKKNIPITFVGYSKIKKEFSKEEIYTLAFVVGHILGDGGIIANGVVHYCNTESFLIEKFKRKMAKVFEDEPAIKIEPSITRLRYPAGIGKTLWCLFGKFSYGKDTKNITKEIEDMPLDWKVKMLRTWFDDDGSAPKFKTGGVVSIKQKFKHLLIFIQRVLKNFKIQSFISKDESRWVLRILSYDSLVKFRDNVNFSEGYRKRDKLDEIIQSIKKPRFKTKKKILELLKEGPKTRYELAKSFDLDAGTIAGHLYGWKRKIGSGRKSQLGLVDFGLVKRVGKGKSKKGRPPVIYMLA